MTGTTPFIGTAELSMISRTRFAPGSVSPPSGTCSWLAPLTADSDVIAGDDLATHGVATEKNSSTTCSGMGPRQPPSRCTASDVAASLTGSFAMANQSDPGEIMGLFADVLDAVGLPTAEVDADGDLDTLLDELFTVAAELDQKGD